MRILFICIALCMCTCLFTACDNEDRTRRPQTRLQVQKKGDIIEVLGPDGRVLIKGNQNNASLIINTDDGNQEALNSATDKPGSTFPSDIPILPGCTITMSQVFNNGKNAIATLTTDKLPETVIQFYENQIPLKGWDPGSRFDLDNIVMLHGKRGSASLNISITAENEMTTINMARTETTEQLSPTPNTTRTDAQMPNKPVSQSYPSAADARQ